MHYQFTVITMSTVIPGGPSGIYTRAPYASYREVIDFRDATVGTMTISDDDSQFNAGYYATGETDQRLVEPATFGYGSAEVTLPAGTQFTNFVGTIIEAPNGDRHVLMYPRLFEAGAIGDEVGGRYSVIAIPLPRTVDDAQVWPTFDPNVEYRAADTIGVAANRDWVLYPPALVEPEPVDPVPTDPDPTDPDPIESPACFASGTLIETVAGPRRVEDLRIGDLVATMDHGFRPILWIGACVADLARLDLRPQDRPIMIAAGALGAGQPQRDLVVSPQHRVLVRSAIAARMLGEPEALVAARHLVGQPGITVRRDLAPVTYWHLLLERHEVINSEGAWTESLYPGPVALRAFTALQRAQIRAALPQPIQGTPAFARPVPRGRQARQLSARHLRHARALVSA